MLPVVCLTFLLHSRLLQSGEGNIAMCSRPWTTHRSVQRPMQQRWRPASLLPRRWRRECLPMALSTHPRRHLQSRMACAMTTCPMTAHSTATSGWLGERPARLGDLCSGPMGCGRALSMETLKTTLACGMIAQCSLCDCMPGL